MKGHYQLLWPLRAALLLVGSAGCATEQLEPEPAAMAMAMLNQSVDSVESGSGSFLGVGFGGVARIASACDDTPQSTEVDACGRAVLGDAEYEWDGCTVEMPQSAPFDAMTTSGNLSLRHSLTGSCADGSSVFEQTSAFEVVRAVTDDMTMTLSGNTTAARPQGPEPMVTLVIDGQRQMQSSRGSATANVSGTLSAQPDDANERLTLNGTMTFAVNHPYRGDISQTLTLSNIVRVSSEVCQWPMNGEVVRSAAGKAHTIAFGPACGEATRDGEVIDLAIARARPGSR